MWSFGDGDSSTIALDSNCYELWGSYTVGLTVTDINGCINSVSIANYITVYPDPIAGFVILSPQPATLEESPIAFADQSSGGDTCKWDFLGNGNMVTAVNCGDIVFTYDDTGTYTVTQIVVNQWNCADTVTQEVIIIPNTTLYVPNTFTPNGDGKNDMFLAYGTYVEDFHMMVFDRWGMLIFESYDINVGWNGRVNNNGGSLAQIDTYVWKIEYTEQYMGYYHRMIGHVNLIR
jgi:gliding motility-associated-like protein